MIGDLVSGVFTTARVEGGSVLRLEVHRARLEADARSLGVSAQELQRNIQDLFKVSVLESKKANIGTLRLAVGRRADGSFSFAHDLTPPRRARFTRGDAPLALVSVSDPRATVDAKRFPRDALNALERACRARGAEPLLVSNGLVREGSWFHLVARTGGVWRAPTEGTIHGTTRRLVLHGLRARGEIVDEGPLRLAELRSGASAFVLSALIEVAPVATLDGGALRIDPTDAERALLVACLGL